MLSLLSGIVRVWHFIDINDGYPFHNQTALVQHLMPRELCSVLIVAKLRKGIGSMQMVPIHHKIQTLMNMVKTFLMLVIQKWEGVSFW
jgi:hypothetical protein